MSNCSRCGVGFHPEISLCPVCGQMRPNELARRRKLLYFINTFAFTAVAVVVGLRLLTAPEIQVGMSSADCNAARQLAEETRFAISDLNNNPLRATIELAEVSTGWSELANNYVPGKYSWSTSGLEHSWLERLSLTTISLSVGEDVKPEGNLDPARYVIDLTRLVPRFCS